MMPSKKWLADLECKALIIRNLLFSEDRTSVIDEEVISFLIEKAVTWLYRYDKGKSKYPYPKSR